MAPIRTLINSPRRLHPLRRDQGRQDSTQATQKHRSFGFVTFLEREDAAAAMDGAELYGRVLTVKYALPEKIKGGEQGWAAQLSTFLLLLLNPNPNPLRIRNSVPVLFDLIAFGVVWNFDTLDLGVYE